MCIENFIDENINCFVKMSQGKLKTITFQNSRVTAHCSISSIIKKFVAEKVSTFCLLTVFRIGASDATIFYILTRRFVAVQNKRKYIIVSLSALKTAQRPISSKFPFLVLFRIPLSDSNVIHIDDSLL